jgi:hypothetical protein
MIGIYAGIAIILFGIVILGCFKTLEYIDDRYNLNYAMSLFIFIMYWGVIISIGGIIYELLN